MDTLGTSHKCPCTEVSVFAHKTVIWDQIRCDYFTGCPHFAGLHFTGVTVPAINPTTILIHVVILSVLKAH
jgi:hypothetical protein